MDREGQCWWRTSIPLPHMGLWDCWTLGRDWGASVELLHCPGEGKGSFQAAVGFWRCCLRPALPSNGQGAPNKKRVWLQWLCLRRVWWGFKVPTSWCELLTPPASSRVCLTQD